MTSISNNLSEMTLKSHSISFFKLIKHLYMIFLIHLIYPFKDSFLKLFAPFNNTIIKIPSVGKNTINLGG